MGAAYSSLGRTKVLYATSFVLLGSDKFLLSDACHGRIQRGTGGPDPPPLKNHRNIGVPGSPKIHKATKPASNGGPLTRQQNAISKASPMGRWWSIFSGISVLSLPPLTKCSGSAHACSACEPARWNGHNFIMRQRLRRACASLHSGMSSITAFMLNGLILCLTTQTTLWKRPFCI